MSISGDNSFVIINDSEFNTLQNLVATPINESQWEKIYDKTGHRIFKQDIPGKNYNRYCTIGSFPIRLQTLYRVFTDCSLRKQWDEYTIDTRIVRQSQEHELIYWTYKFPFPMSNRDYVLTRRTKINENETEISIIMKAVTIADLPEKKDFVRVVEYEQYLNFKRINDIDTEYFCISSFDIGGTIPSFIINWALSKGVAQFIKQTIEAANIIERAPK
eukprot:TRINITY_DN1490_c2_g1_i1.p1 TRINITY_DN1490_c2_g1~~TRINITY_DN1490_c2_g1_i1.p1  ORF type:complete len:217 (+),score=76.04 TRINITY_DN1490_c2_g1_i1:83-733(+)